MSELRLHDSLTQKLAPLVPRRPGEVRVYCCGPTTYDAAHVGHGRAALAPDVLVRHLRARGLRVVYARNITDVDDKILQRAAESGEAPLELSARMAHLYQEDMAALGCLPPDVEPKVSEHIPEVVALIERLIERGAAYVAARPGESPGVSDVCHDGHDARDVYDVYYAVRSFPDYGKLSKRNLDELRVGARIGPNEDKRDPLDFALWKGVAAGGWGWDSPWGKGRPGWHIECSAMACRYLGPGFDVHCGGMDLVFPHHENEIAQSEAACPEAAPLASIWIHNGFVNVDKEKMAKSLGNFVRLSDVYARNDPEALRYFLLTVHYRGPIAFDTHRRDDGRVVFPGVVEAERRVDYLYATLDRLSALSALPGPPGEGAAPELPAKLPRELAPFVALADGARERAAAALDDDLNTPVVLSIVAEVAKAANELADLAQKRRKDQDIARAAPPLARRLGAALRASLDVLGLLQTPPEVYQARTQERRLGLLGTTRQAIEAKLAERAEARAARDFARGDAIRRELERDGIEVADAPTGTTFRVIV
ncbi:cysteinyl-tRNA synthetase [Sorangium cellulosum]|uniref:Cysteine--tRNA ligase n=1 Tax=Sorangium cellulosum TaxID=56 RepID=A0A2L0EJL4_SORCE|nr:cysteine--tRNA ligase [Sorangium cellulosum]AUX39490.1 cysteinyl-tRNA synthetase [Sorangium cellulosum]